METVQMALMNLTNSSLLLICIVRDLIKPYMGKAYTRINCPTDIKLSHDDLYDCCHYESILHFS